MSKNQVALAEGRITQDQYDSMAAYKYTRYGNTEDLDYDADYSDYGLEKIRPTVKYYPATTYYPEVVAEVYKIFSRDIEDEDLREAVSEYDDGAVYISYTNIWYWVPSGSAGGDASYILDILNEDLEYPGRLEVDSTYDILY